MTTIPSNDTDSNNITSENPQNPEFQEGPYCELPTEELNWVITQPHNVQKLWLLKQLWSGLVKAKQSGGDEDNLKTSLSHNEFEKAEKILEEKELSRPLMKQRRKTKGFQKSV